MIDPQAFQEMGRIYFDIMRDSMFEGDGNKKVDTYDSDTDEPDPDIFYRYQTHPSHSFPQSIRKTSELYLSGLSTTPCLISKRLKRRLG